ncbi:MAG: hypothetical protein DME09_15760 [Candidatus Rokuibacteriota bacterium]|nr:MAG: hypothetical protein DME09_15760 [Candidatus Rokubacteria bacterium]
MRRTQLPLDGQAYVESLRELERLIRATPDLSNLATIRTFLAAAPRSLLGERTVGECLAADDEKLRVLLHYMILGSSAMGDLHPASRGWLNRGGYPPPPWDPESRPYGKERVITYGGRLGAIVAWEPARSVAFGEGLTEVERRWVLALAIGAGERPEWSDAELERFAAYLTMGGASFAREREVNDAEIAAKYGVPEAMVAYRRSLDDLDL